MAPSRSIPPLTSKRIEALSGRGKEYSVCDGGAPGLQLCVTAAGSKVFRWFVLADGAQRKITIGRWSRDPKVGHVTLAEARMWLARLKAAHQGGRLDTLMVALRAGEVRPQRSVVEPMTVSAIAEQFFEYIQRRRRRPEQARRPLDFDILPAIGDRPIVSITTRECCAIVESVVARGSRSQAGVVLAVLKQLFKFACARGELLTNPTAPLRDPEALGVIRNVDQRILRPDELACFWKVLDAAQGMTPAVRNGLKLLLLLGVRSGELLRARWGEVNLGDCAAVISIHGCQPTWTIPVENQKLTKRREPTARPWIVPLSPVAAELLRELKAEASNSPFVMASPRGRGGRLTEQALNHALRRLYVADETLRPFATERPTAHDLRRSMRTHLGETLGVAWHIAERCLNHSLGKISATYDVGDYVTERRAALEKWEAYVRSLATAKESMVL